MANPTIRGVSSGPITTGSLNVSMTVPAGTIAGDEIIFFISFSNNFVGTHTVPTGYTVPPGVTSPLSSGGHTAAVIRKVASGTAGQPTTDTAPVSYAWTSASSGSWTAISIGNPSVTNPFDAGAELVGTVADVSHIVPSVDPVRTREGLLISLVAADNVAGTSLSYNLGSSGLTQQVLKSEINTSTAAIFTEALTTDAVVPQKSITASSASRYVAYSFVVAPSGTSSQRHLGNNAEGGTINDDPLTVANSGGASGTAVDNVVGDIRFNNIPPVPMIGSWCYKLSQPTAAQSKFQWNASSGVLTEFWWREYRVITSAPAGNLILLQSRGLNSSGITGNSGGSRIAADMNLTIFDSTSTGRYVGTTPLPLNKLIRLEYHIIHSETVGHIESWLYWDDGISGHGPHSNVPSLSLGNMTDNWNLRLNSNEHNAGIMTSTTGNLHYLDDVVLSTTGKIGPADVPNTTTAWFFYDQFNNPVKAGISLL